MAQALRMTTLTIQNFATFKNQTIHFSDGLNGIIGETGSGKSLVLDALACVFGGRFDKKIIRRGSDFAVVELNLKFHCKEIELFLQEEGHPCESGDITVKRIIQSQGGSKYYLNHLLCSSSVLIQFSRKFLDFVGQFDNQKILSPAFLLHTLDIYSQNADVLEQYQKDYNRYNNLKEEVKQLEFQLSQVNQRRDYINFQLNELNQLNPSTEDEVQLLKLKNIFLNAEKNVKTLELIQHIFWGGEEQSGLFEYQQQLRSILQKSGDLFQEELAEILIITEMYDSLYKKFTNKLETDISEINFDEVLSRLDQYQKLKRKLGVDTEQLVQHKTILTQEIESYQSSKELITEKNMQILSLEKSLTNIANQLHSTRVKKSKELSKKITQSINELRMNGASIHFIINKGEQLNENGFSDLTVIAETNPGEGYFTLKDIASGGELSRILLSLRNVLAENTYAGIFIFDEIDTGLDTDTAISVGKALKQIATHRQVITVTHVPQIAQYCDSLTTIKKFHTENRTESRVENLSGKLILKEVTKMSQLAS